MPQDPPSPPRAVRVCNAHEPRPSAHGLSELVYAITSAANSKESALGGLSGTTTFYNTLLATVMLAGRYLPVVAVRGLAGSLARQRPAAVTEGTLRTH
jgi:potassium-transporting ATPase potassium-binding subunit